MTVFRLRDSRDGNDPALSTKMFLVSSAENDDNSDVSSSNAHLGSSENNENGQRALDQKLARLQRAQKLLEKSQRKHSK